MTQSITVTRMRGNAGTSLFTQPGQRKKASSSARVVLVLLALLLCLVIAAPSFAQSVPAPASPATISAPATPVVGDALDRALGDIGKSTVANQQSGNAPMALSLQILIIMGLLTILPGILLMMTSFTRIIIVLSILRQALGLQQTPPNQVLVGLALFLSFFCDGAGHQPDQRACHPALFGRENRCHADDRNRGRAAS